MENEARKKKPREWRGWAGFVDGKLDMGWIEAVKYTDKTYGIFKTRKEARKRYQDVRPVTITLKGLNTKKK